MCDFWLANMVIKQKTPESKMGDKLLKCFCNRVYANRNDCIGISFSPTVISRMKRYNDWHFSVIQLTFPSVFFRYAKSFALCSSKLTFIHRLHLDSRSLKDMLLSHYIAHLSFVKMHLTTETKMTCFRQHLEKKIFRNFKV